MNHFLVRFVVLVCFGSSLFSCGGDGGGGGAEGPAPRFVVATHGTADFGDGDLCPYYVDFSIFLEAGGTGWVALEHDAVGSNLVEVAWQDVDGTIQITAPEHLVYAEYWDDPDWADYGGAEVGWRDLSFRVEDEDGDGTAEVGEASITITCDEFWFHGDYYEREADFELETNPYDVGLFIEDSDGWEPLYTWRDTITVRASSPVLAETIAGAALLADGVAIPATVLPLDPHGPLADGFLLEPAQPIPFSVDLTVDPGGATDVSGAPVTFTGSAVRTISDPGPITDNPSFETTGGWINAWISSSEWWDGFEVPDGDRYAVQSTGSNMIGYFDVPPDATTLTFEEATYNDFGDCNNGGWVSVQASVHLPTTSERVDPVDCDDCDAWGEIIPWHTVTIDVSQVRGQRVVINAYPSRFSECVPDLYPDLLLDNFRIRP